MQLALWGGGPMPRNTRQAGYSMIEILGVVAIVGIVSAIALPVSSRAIGGLRVRGNARAIANSVTLAKMRAASAFTRARVFVDLGTNSFFIQTWNKTSNAWETEGGALRTSTGVTFGFGSLAAPPPNTQAAIAQAPPCTDNAANNIAGTSCIVFNSRGIPIDAAGSPMSGNAFYITDGTGVYATTLTATPMIRLWWSPASGAVWAQQ